MSCIFHKYISVAPPPVSLGYSLGSSRDELAEDVVIVTGSRRVADVKEAVQENLGDYKLYRAPQAVTVAPHQTKQIAFLSKGNLELKAQGSYRWKLSSLRHDFYEYFDSDGINPLPPVFGTILYALDNDKHGNLAVPLPAGTVRAMSQTPDGLNVFLGEDIIPNSPIDRAVELEIGKSFLVTAQFIAVDIDDEDAGMRVDVRNATDERITAEFDFNQYEDIEILSDGKNKSLTGGNKIYKLSVPAEGLASFTFGGDWD